MMYWENDFVEVRNIYGNIFNSPIKSPAIRGENLDNDGNTISTYEMEVVDQPCKLQTRVNEEDKRVTDMCILMEFRSTLKDLDGVSSSTFPVPITELTQELQTILIKKGIIK